MSTQSLVLQLLLSSSSLKISIVPPGIINSSAFLFCSAQFNILASLHITSHRCHSSQLGKKDRLYRHFQRVRLFSIKSLGWFDENRNISFNSVPRRNSANSQENFTSLTFQSFPTSLFRWPFTSLPKIKIKTKYFKVFPLALHIAGKHISSKYSYRNTRIKNVEILNGLSQTSCK